MDSNTAIDMPEFNSAAPQQPPVAPKKKLRFEDIYLIFSGSLFVLSIGFMVNNAQSLTTNSQANIRTTTTIPATTDVSNVKYPKTFKNEAIPQTVYTSADSVTSVPPENKEEYIKDKVMRFFAYKDVLADQSIAVPKELMPVSFQDVLDGTEALETLIFENLLSKADFGYIHVKFVGNPDEETLKQHYGDLDAKAQELIKKYQQMIVVGEFTPQQIIDISNKDEEILALNSGEKNAFIDGYDASQNPFKDQSFNEFLFAQQANQLSDVFTLKDNEIPYAYVIVYANKVTKKDYNSLDEIVTQKESNFAY